MCLERRTGRVGDEPVKERAIYISIIHGLGNQKRTISLQGKTLKTHPQPCPLFCEEEKSQKGLSQIHTSLWLFELGFVYPNPVLKSATPLFWQIKNVVTGLIEKSVIQNKHVKFKNMIL